MQNFLLFDKPNVPSNGKVIFSLHKIKHQTENPFYLSNRQNVDK